jgi:predicted enzyme involved in methoxymalonyl-ACP biosynthesis
MLIGSALLCGSSASALAAAQRATPSMVAARDRALPRAVVFDLDGCLWYPDM